MDRDPLELKILTSSIDLHGDAKSGWFSIWMRPG